MLKFRDYSLIKVTKELTELYDQTSVDLGGSVFHESFLNQLVSETFDTEFFYLVNDPQSPTHFTPVHRIKNSMGRIDYHLKPLFDIPYAGFVGQQPFTVSEFKVGNLESINYEGFPYFKTQSPVESDEIGETCMVDLSMTEEDIFMKVINAKKRNKIRKAEKEGVIVKSSKEKSAFDEFWTILEPLHKKLGFRKELDYNYYAKMFEVLAKDDKASILLAYKEDQLLSGVMLIGNKNYMHYYKGASQAGVRNQGQGELLQWEAIRYSKNASVSYYDLCNLNKEKLPAIYSFKTGISNHIIQFPRYSSKPLGYKIANKLTEWM